MRPFSLIVICTQGGAIDGSFEDSTFSNVSISFCSTETEGGAIFAAFKNSNILDCTFDSNYAPEGGGAIFAMVTDGNYLNITRSTFRNNSAANFGGMFFQLE